MQNSQNETIGQRVRRLRKSAGMYQWQLAQKIHCAPVTITHLEGDKHGANMFTFIDIARALGVSLDYLAYGVEHRGNS